MKKTILVAALALGTALAASASDPPNKPKGQTTTVTQQGQIGIMTPFRVSAQGETIFVVNAGTADWKGGLDVSAACTPVAPTTSCGSSFPGGTFKVHYAQFPAGHGPGIIPNGPSQTSGGLTTQQSDGPGWIAVPMGLPAGSYKITARAANNYSPETAVTIAAPQTGISPHPAVQVNPAASQLAPTKPPTPLPRRP